MCDGSRSVHCPGEGRMNFCCQAAVSAPSLTRGAVARA